MPSNCLFSNIVLSILIFFPLFLGFSSLLYFLLAMFVVSDSCCSFSLLKAIAICFPLLFATANYLATIAVALIGRVITTYISHELIYTTDRSQICKSESIMGSNREGSNIAHEYYFRQLDKIYIKE